MHQIQPDEDHHHNREDADGAVPVQANSQEQARDDEVISVARTQSTDQVIQRGCDKQWVERETQSHPADDVRPVANACQ